MKKVISLLPFLLLLAFAIGAQQPVTVSGHVLNEADGSPVPAWFVIIGSLDSLNPGGPAGLVAITDADGFYSIPVDVPAGATTVQAQTFDNCFGIAVLANALIVNGEATADFRICSNTTQQDCFLDAWSFPTSGLTVQFQASAHSFLDSAAVFTYTWDFGDGSTGSGPNPEHTYPAEGSFVATVTAVSDDCTVTQQVHVWVYEPYNGPVDTIFISGHLYNIQDSLPVAGWWVTAAGVDPFFPLFGFSDTEGYYEFLLTVPAGDSVVTVTTYDCTGLSVQQTAAISPAGTATADFYLCHEAPPPPPGCAAYLKYIEIDSLTYQFEAQYWSNTDSSGTPAQYAWDFGDGATSTGASPVHTYAQDGLYTVSLTVTDGSGCVAYACDIVCTYGGGVIDTFWYGCQAMFYGFPVFDPAGGANSMQFNDLSFGAVQSWHWDFGDGSTSTDQNPLHIYADEGTYLVKLAIETLDGCESEMVMEAYIGNNPGNQWGCQAMFIPLPDSSAGSATGFFFADLSTAPAPIVSWLWDFGDGTTSTEQFPYHAYAQPGIYPVTLSIFAADSCSSQITYELDTENPLRFTDANAPSLGISGTSGTSENPGVLQGLKIFPNPATSDITLAFDSRAEGDFEIRVCDLAGRALRTSALRANAGANLAQVNIARLTPGFYLAQIVGAQGAKAVKFAKQ